MINTVYNSKSSGQKIEISKNPHSIGVGRACLQSGFFTKHRTIHA